MRISSKSILDSILAFGLAFIILQCGGNSVSGKKEIVGSSAVRTKEVFFADMYNNPYREAHLSRHQYRGKLIYDHYCAVCHGENGDGNGFNSFNLQDSFGIRPFNFADSTAAPLLKLAEIKRAIEGGGRAVGKSQYMPPWGKTLRDDEIIVLIDYIRTFIPML